MRLQLLETAFLACNSFAATRRIEALAVNAHARSDKKAFDGILSECLKQDRGAFAVHARILGDLIHALADADRGREVVDRVDILQCSRHGFPIAHVADDQFDIVREVVRPLRVLAMNLRR